ncbi:hypothetical protein D3C78_1570890 [compost metagenome]
MLAYPCVKVIMLLISIPSFSTNIARVSGEFNGVGNCIGKFFVVLCPPHPALVPDLVLSIDPPTEPFTRNVVPP